MYIDRWIERYIYIRKYETPTLKEGNMKHMLLKRLHARLGRLRLESTFAIPRESY